MRFPSVKTLMTFAPRTLLLVRIIIVTFMNALHDIILMNSIGYKSITIRRIRGFICNITRLFYAISPDFHSLLFDFIALAISTSN